MGPADDSLFSQCYPNLCIKVDPNLFSQSNPNLLSQCYPNLCIKVDPNLFSQSYPNLLSQCYPNLCIKVDPNLFSQSYPNLFSQGYPNLCIKGDPNLFAQSYPILCINLRKCPNSTNCTVRPFSGLLNLFTPKQKLFSNVYPKQKKSKKRPGRLYVTTN